jgi:UDP-N-acetylmuramoyl-tripeptide--D-alanyl-D-alanine ligase
MICLECTEREAMAILSIENILTATNGKLICRTPDSFTGVSIDSRKILKGELFIALKGSRFDGHDFLQDALEKGSGAIVSLQAIRPADDKTIIYVEDTLKALQDIAHYIRMKMDMPVVAVTGSNGKTTTKELISSILATQYKVMKNTGNLNNHIGLPLSLAGINEDDEVIVLEMGASAPGEIKTLCDIAVPGYGVLTNISPAHLEGFGDIGTVRNTKLEMLDTVDTAIVNADDLFMMEGIELSGYKGRIVRFGIKNPADVRASDIKLHDKGSSFSLHIGEYISVEVNPKISGMFNIYNLLAAAAVGSIFHIDIMNIRDAVDSFAGVPMRLEFQELDGVRIISDVYNANPASTGEALKELARIRKERIIAVLGDMLELGSYEDEAHRKIGKLISELGVDIFIAVGPRMGIAASEFHGEVYTLETATEAGKLLRGLWKKGDTVLIKGSRGMNMEKVLADGP